MNNLSTDDAGFKDSTTSGSDVIPLHETPEYRTSVMIWKICPPFIVLLGAFGNITAFFIMHRIKDHNSSQHAILMALAVSDFTLLCTEPINRWLKNVFDIELRLLHTALCKFFLWVTRFTEGTSAWLVTCVTVQRTMAVLWPHRMRVMCTVRRTWIVIAAVFLVAFALNVHILFGMDISKENRCQTIPGVYRYFYVVIFAWMHLCVASVAPSLCLFVCDVILSVTLFKAVSSTSSISAQVDQNARGGLDADSRRKTYYRTTVMVLAISCAFLVLTLPKCVYLIWSSFIFTIIGRHPQTIPVVNLVYAVTKQLMYTNSAINFYLYCLTGTKFRREFVNWISCGVKSSSAPSVQETASEASRGGRHKHPGKSPPSK